MNDQIHFISQYLATSGKSFLEHRPDDSHTNVGFNSTTKSLETWDLDKNGLKLIFDLTQFKLKWNSEDLLELELNGKSHRQVVEWLEKSAIQVGLKKPYTFDLHYDLPFEWNDQLSFELNEQNSLKELIRLRILANGVLDSFLSSANLKSDIRIWPHHFDTGAFAILEDSSGKSIGMGMAIPDALINDHYFYLSGYHGHDGINTSGFKTLSMGEWKNEGFKGAVIAASNITNEEAIKFFEESYQEYLGAG